MDKLTVFTQHQGALFAIAYRMLSSSTDAEDVLQEAWIRWQSTSASVANPKSYLSTVVTRLCIDYLRSARVRRERYIGTWLPEPLATSATSVPEEHIALAESLSFAFLRLLECLSPTERAVFLLREVFDYSYEETALTVGKSVSNCRQIMHRAKQHLVLRKPSRDLSFQQKEQTVELFVESWREGDLEKLMMILTEDVVFWSDGGGKVTAALHPLKGASKVARFFRALHRSRLIPQLTSHIACINNQPAVVNAVDGCLQSIFNFDFQGSCIKTIFAVANPDKLNNLSTPVKFP